jgi:hypothetical protein
MVDSVDSDEENIIQFKQRGFFNSSFVRNLSNGYSPRICMLSLRLKIRVVT